MFCRIPASQDASAPIINIATIADLLNPTKHRLWELPLNVEGRVYVRDFHRTLKLLYSRENINNPSFRQAVLPFNPRGHGVAETIFNQFIQHIPDHLLYTLNWLHVQVPSGNTVRIYRFRFQDYSSSSICEVLIDYSDRTFNNGQEAATWFTEAATLLEDYFITKGSLLWSSGSTQSTHNFGSTLSSFITNRKYISDGRTSYTARQMLNFFNNSSDITLSAETINGTWANGPRFTMPINYENRSRLYQVFGYSTDVTSLLPGKRKLPNEGTPVYVGVELEVSTDYEINELIDASKELFFVAKQDSSISGRKRNKMELVTVPGSFKYLKKQYALWFNNLDYQKFDCTNDTNNGMHVHIDRRSFDDDYHIRNFCWFINNPANTPFIVAVSDRGSLQAMQTYCPIYNYPPNYTRTQGFKAAHRLIEHSRGATHLKGGWAGGKTLEVRIFRGIVSYAAITKNLEFVESVFLFTQSLRSYREMSLSNYINWLFSQPVNRFAVLKKFLEQQDISKFLVAAEVKDVIFNESDPGKIIQLLSKSGLTINNHHIAYLNKGKKRTFVLDKETGAISVTQTNLFKLSNLDIDLAKKFTHPVRAA